jgi:hypothetical protein
MEVLASLQKGPLEAGQAGSEVRLLDKGEAERANVRGLHDRRRFELNLSLERVVGSLQKGASEVGQSWSEVRFLNEGKAKSIRV